MIYAMIVPKPKVEINTEELINDHLLFCETEPILKIFIIIWMNKNFMKLILKISGSRKIIGSKNN